MTDINIDNYLTEEDKHRIAHEVFRGECRKRSQEDFERIVTNSAYHVVWAAVDECFDEDTQTLLKSKVLKIIEDMSDFTIFRTPNAWDRVENMTYGVLLQTVRENKELLDSKIKEGLESMTRKQKSDLAYKLAEQSLHKN